MPPRIGDHYQLERPLGRGGMGTVFQAMDLRTGQPVAIKWLGEPGSSPGDKALGRFEQEARIAGSLASPHVARVFDVGRDPRSGVPYLAMELLSGEDLQALLDRAGALAAGAAVRIALQACRGLAAAHAAGVVHRDVKPSNLFLSRGEGGTVVLKVVDFGIAKIRRLAPGVPSGSIAAPAVSMTASGEMLGSPLFMAPEQVEASKDVDARADVFSLGVVMYAMITGRPPHAHIRSFVQLLSAIVSAPAPPLVAAAPGVPPEVAAVVDRAMAHEREARYADSAAMLAALEACAPPDRSLREEMLVGAGAAPRAEVNRAAATARSTKT